MCGLIIFRSIVYDSKNKYNLGGNLYVGQERVTRILEENFSFIGKLSSQDLSEIKNYKFDQVFIKGSLFIYKIK